MSMGMSLLALMIALVIATFISEDLTLIVAGLLVAGGTIDLGAAILACLAGIWLGDMGLFLAGRYLGRPGLHRRPLRWIVKPQSLAPAESWFESRGSAAIVFGRFVPGLRLPTYFAAGMLGMRPARAGFWFFFAALIWTPLLVISAVWIGRPVLIVLERYERFAPLWALAFLGLLYAIWKLLLPATTWHGRRRLVGRWRRLRAWEYWPIWAVYPPVLAYIAWLSLRSGGLRTFTAANPGMPGGGLKGESKQDILGRLRGAGEVIPAYRFLAEGASPLVWQRTASAFAEEQGWPLVLKPDVGERGRGVSILRDRAELNAALAEAEGQGAWILQAYVSGPELGVFYERAPGEARGRVTSISRKELPELVGDGERTLEELVLADERAVAMARAYACERPERWYEVPEAGERVRLVDVGTHARGAIFRDARELWTPELEAEIERISRAFEGFHIGRYDLRAPSIAAFREGRELRVIELNGVTAEPLHVYEPGTPWRQGVATLCATWRRIYEIGAANRARGSRPTSLGELWRLVAS